MTAASAWRGRACGGVGFAIALCATPLAANTADKPARAPATATAAAPAKLMPCRVKGIATEVQCGSVKRPLNPAQPQGRQMDVHFAVLPALARHKLPDPIVMFAGGPGQSGIDLAPAAEALFKRANTTRDIVLFDQRGVGKSLKLGCKPDPREPMARVLDDDHAVAEAKRCHDRLSAEHQLSPDDWRQFTTDIAMQDVDAIRAALGVERWNLVGGSYGTRAALEYLRQFPQRVRRVVLDGVAPSDMNLPESVGLDVPAALETLLASCTPSGGSAPKGCAYSQLRTHWQQLMQRLPEPITVTHPATFQRETVTVTGAAVETSVRGALYAPAVAAALPFAIQQAAQGRYDALLGIRGALGTPGAELANAMHFAVVCSEDWPRGQPWAPGEVKFGQALARNYAQICPTYPRKTMPKGFDTIAPAQVPVLVLSGSADPVTPPRHGERVAKALGAKARHVVAPNVGHGVMAVPCMREKLSRFIQATTNDDALKLDMACAQQLPYPTAFLPMGVRAADVNLAVTPPTPHTPPTPPASAQEPADGTGGRP